jgi:hypothetical protein
MQWNWPLSLAAQQLQLPPPLGPLQLLAVAPAMPQLGLRAALKEALHRQLI